MKVMNVNNVNQKLQLTENLRKMYEKMEEEERLYRKNFKPNCIKCFDRFLFEKAVFPRIGVFLRNIFNSTINRKGTFDFIYIRSNPAHLGYDPTYEKYLAKQSKIERMPRTTCKECVENCFKKLFKKDDKFDENKSS